MSSRISLRTEIILVALGVGLVALLYRYAWLPVFWEAQLAAAEAHWGLPVSGAGRWVSGWTLGDGQAFALIAADPLGLDYVAKLGQPAYRFMRAGFGWLSWAASLGRAEWVPYGMAIVGALSVAATFGVAAWLRPRLGHSAWLIVVNPAVFIGFAGDTAEALGVLFLALSLAVGGRWAAVALGVTRPSYMVGFLGRWRQLAWGGGAAAVLLAYGLLRFGMEFSQFGGRLGIPILGYIEAGNLASGVVALLAVGTVVVGLRHRDWGWVAAGLFVLSFSSYVVAESVNAWRAAGLLPVLWAFGPAYERERGGAAERDPAPVAT